MTAIDRTFDLIVQAAIRGERCPTNDQLPAGSKFVGQLAKAGRIVVKVFDKNFRVVTILEGEHKGKSMAGPPESAANSGPYLVVNASGTFRNGEPVDTRAFRPPPSRPRDYSRGAW